MPTKKVSAKKTFVAPKLKDAASLHDVTLVSGGHSGRRGGGGGKKGKHGHGGGQHGHGGGHSRSS